MHLRETARALATASLTSRLGRANRNSARSQSTYTRAFARLTPELRGVWEERAEARAQAFCDGLANDLALMTPQDAEAG